jgi:hypothetical protein
MISHRKAQLNSVNYTHNIYRTEQTPSDKAKTEKKELKIK